MKCRRWTEEEDDILRSNYPTLGGKETARLLDRTYKAVRCHAHVNSIKVNNRLFVDEDYFLEWTNNMAYTLGYIYADGHVTKAGNRLQLHCHRKDDEIIHQILEDMKFRNKIYYIPASHTNNRNNGEAVAAHINNRHLVGSLNNHGLVHDKTYQDCHLPYVPDEYLCHFARGYFDGDGCISIKSGRYFECTFLATKTFALQLQDKIAQAVGVGIRPLFPNGKIFHMVWTRLAAVQAITRWLYPPGDYIFLKRKRDKMELSLSITRKLRIK